ncbi:hypothetical protein, partial [Rhodopirellula baltica]|uniref:hypothetical protein n=1 Tax=Rhodopirellula baltica TaxID=265606 RepID=UPI000561E781
RYANDCAIRVRYLFGKIGKKLLHDFPSPSGLSSPNKQSPMNVAETPQTHTVIGANKVPPADKSPILPKRYLTPF